MSLHYLLTVKAIWLSQLTLSKPSPENNKDKKPDDTVPRSFHLKVLLNYVIILSYMIEDILIWAVTYVNASLSQSLNGLEMEKGTYFVSMQKGRK